MAITNMKPLNVLIINPNTSTNMTKALEPVITALPFSSVSYSFYTCPPLPGSIPSINSPSDANASAEVCFPSILPLIPKYDAFVVACYSHHPLVSKIRDEFTSEKRQYVTGIFESSVLTSLNIIPEDGAFGIVSTGKIWEEGLTRAVNQYLGLEPTGSKSLSARFKGCETTGLNATELHDLPIAEVQKKMKEATKRLIKRPGANVGAICLGCAGMVGLDDAVREACVEELGEERGGEIRIVDGVKAAVALSVGAARGGF